MTLSESDVDGDCYFAQINSVGTPAPWLARARQVSVAKEVQAMPPA
jgi:hypothetical protein